MWTGSPVQLAGAYRTAPRASTTHPHLPSNNLLLGTETMALALLTASRLYASDGHYAAPTHPCDRDDELFFLGVIQPEQERSPERP
jgi:hypothetical protein